MVGENFAADVDPADACFVLLVFDVGTDISEAVAAVYHQTTQALWVLFAILVVAEISSYEKTTHGYQALYILNTTCKGRSETFWSALQSSLPNYSVSLSDK